MLTVEVTTAAHPPSFTLGAEDSNSLNDSAIGESESNSNTKETNGQLLSSQNGGDSSISRQAANKLDINGINGSQHPTPAKAASTNNFAVSDHQNGERSISMTQPHANGGAGLTDKR